MLTGLLLAVLFGALSGALWGGLDVAFYRFTRTLVQETQITQIVRMVIAGMLAQNIASYLIVLVFHALPGGGLLSLVSIVLSILIYFNARMYFSRGDF
jgi:hypothetical protein